MTNDQKEMLNSDAYLEFLFYLGMCPLKWKLIPEELRDNTPVIRARVEHIGGTVSVCPITAVYELKTNKLVTSVFAWMAGVKLGLSPYLVHFIILAADNSSSTLDEVGKEIRRDLLKATGLSRAKKN